MGAAPGSRTPGLLNRSVHAASSSKRRAVRTPRTTEAGRGPPSVSPNGHPMSTCNGEGGSRAALPRANARSLPLQPTPSKDRVGKSRGRGGGGASTGGGGSEGTSWRRLGSTLGLCGSGDLLIVPQITASPFTQDPDSCLRRVA